MLYSDELRHNFIGTLLMGAIGDSAGWPYEFNHITVSHDDLMFHNWFKNVGGYWWGHEEEIHAGDYSDDTQLSLAICRSIDDKGNFLPHVFAYEELPLWLQYERGGGRSTKGAVRNILTASKSSWNNNFYKFQEIDYRNAGANGAAMRIAPLVLCNLFREEKLYFDIFQSSISTHGHPRAILGSLIVATFLRSILLKKDSSGAELLEFLRKEVTEFRRYIEKEEIFVNWLHSYNNVEFDFFQLYEKTAEEIYFYASKIESTDTLDEYIDLLGASTKELRGSGISSMLLPFYVYLKNIDNLSINLVTLLAYRNGIDTDTAASVLGWFLGANLGYSSIPNHLTNSLQDAEYVVKCANRMWRIATNKNNNSNEFSRPSEISKRDYFAKLWAWDIGLYEMFWESISIGGYVHHPSLGRGTIEDKSMSDVRHQRDGKSYQKARVKIAFDLGQTCVFSTRLIDGHLPESGLSAKVGKYLNSTI